MTGIRWSARAILLSNIDFGYDIIGPDGFVLLLLLLFSVFIHLVKNVMEMFFSERVFPLNSLFDREQPV